MAFKEVFKQTDQAIERQKELAEEGITSKILVDPMQGIFPSHSELENVVLMVDEEGKIKKAS